MQVHRGETSSSEVSSLRKELLKLREELTHTVQVESSKQLLIDQRVSGEAAILESYRFEVQQLQLEVQELRSRFTVVDGRNQTLAERERRCGGRTYWHWSHSTPSSTLFRLKGCASTREGVHTGDMRKPRYHEINCPSGLLGNFSTATCEPREQ
eukprot:2596847-Amphidinium_carterae.1